MLTLQPTAYDDDVALALVRAMERELDVRYGEASASPAGVQDFLPPVGTFLVARLDDVPVGCAGLRSLREGVGEIKKMYVDPAARGHGAARALLRALQEHARGVRLVRLQLETGTKQPEAIGLYESEGWSPIEPYGHYRHLPLSRCYALDL